MRDPVTVTRNVTSSYKDRLKALRKTIIEKLCEDEDWLYKHQTLGLSAKELKKIPGPIIETFAHFVSPIPIKNTYGIEQINGKSIEKYYAARRKYMYASFHKDKDTRKANLCELFVSWLQASVIPQICKLSATSELEHDPDNEFSRAEKKTIVAQMIKDEKLLDFFDREAVSKSLEFDSNEDTPVNPITSEDCRYAIFINPPDKTTLADKTQLTSNEDRSRVISPTLFSYILSITKDAVDDEDTAQLKKDYSSYKTRIQTARNKVVQALTEAMKKANNVCFDKDLKTIDETKLRSLFKEPERQWDTIRMQLTNTATRGVSSASKTFGEKATVYFRTETGKIVSGTIVEKPGASRADGTTVLPDSYDVKLQDGTLYQDLAKDVLNPPDIQKKHVGKYPKNTMVWFKPKGEATTLNDADCIHNKEPGSNMDLNILKFCHKGQVVDGSNHTQMVINDFHDRKVNVGNAGNIKWIAKVKTIPAEWIVYYRQPRKDVTEKAKDATGKSRLTGRSNLPPVFDAHPVKYEDRSTPSGKDAHELGGGRRQAGTIRTRRHPSSSQSSAVKTAKRQRTTTAVQRKVLTKRGSPGPRARIHTRKPVTK